MTANTDSTEESTTERTGEKLLAGATLLVALAVAMTAVSLLAAPAAANVTGQCDGTGGTGVAQADSGLTVNQTDTVNTVPAFPDSETINYDEFGTQAEINISSVGSASAELSEWNGSTTCLENVTATGAAIDVAPDNRNNVTVEGNLTLIEVRDVVYDPNDGAVDLSYDATGEALNSLTLETSVSDGETVEAIDTSDGSTLDTATVNNGEVTFTGLPDDQRDVRFQSQSAGGGGQVSLSNLVLPDDVSGPQNTTFIGGGDSTVEVDVTNGGSSQASVDLNLEFVDSNNVVQYTDTVTEQVAASGTTTVTFTGVTGFPVGNFDVEVSVVGSNENISGGLTGSIDVNGNDKPAGDAPNGPSKFNGLFDDVAGTGGFGIVDVVALFRNFDENNVDNNAEFFRFNKPNANNPTRVGIADVVALFREV